jgi:hypothetical protein
MYTHVNIRHSNAVLFKRWLDLGGALLELPMYKKADMKHRM